MTTLDEGRWAAFVDGHPAASIFHTPEMHRVFEATTRCQPSILAEVDERAEIRALMTTVAIATLPGPLAPISTRTVAYAAPIAVPGEAGRRAVATLLEACRRGTGRTSVFTEIRHVAPAGDLAPTLAAAGFRHEPHLNFLVDLRDDPWSRLSKSARRGVREAELSNVTLVDAATTQHVCDGYAVLAEVYRRVRVPLADVSLFDAAMQILAPLGRFRMLLAQVDDRTVGVEVLLSFRGRATSWYGGSRLDVRELRVDEFALWRAIDDSRSSGMTEFDFGGAGHPDDDYGVRDFKAKFGGQLVNYGRDLMIPSAVRYRVVSRAYDLVRRYL